VASDPRPSFVNLPKPFLCSVITEVTVDAAVRAIRVSDFDGAQAFLFDLLALDRAHHNADDLRRIFLSTDKPIMVYYYRRVSNRHEPVTDDTRAESFLLSVEAGASAVDMMADLFDHNELELSRDPEVIRRQKELIHQIRDFGAEVMVSSHTMIKMSTAEVLAHVEAMLDREPDMVKIVPRVPTIDDLTEAFQTTVALDRMLSIPFIHIVMGEYNKIHRIVGPMLGSSLCFCVPYYNEGVTLEQPLLRATREVFNNFSWRPARSVEETESAE